MVRPHVALQEAAKQPCKVAWSFYNDIVNEVSVAHAETYPTDIVSV